MNNNHLSCFKAYDIRGRLGLELNEEIAHRIGRSAAEILKAENIVVGYDARASSPELAASVVAGVREAGASVLDIGLAGTEEMYWAVTSQGASAGIEVTASHNPIDYNGMKIVKEGSQPLTEGEFQSIRRLAEAQTFKRPTVTSTELFDCSLEARRAYLEKIVDFVDISRLKPLKIVVNSGNGAAGPTFDALAHKLAENGVEAEFIRVHHTPDATFPNGIPNPLIPENQAATSDVVKENKADFGVAFDGDFDRCFFFDEEGVFVPGEYLVGLLSKAYLRKEPGAKIVHDPRVIWNTLDAVNNAGGRPLMVKTGHAFIKQAMRESEALYGGEMSAHHYFREFAYCDSGMIPWLLVWELISTSGKSLGQLLNECRTSFPSSGEWNFRVRDPAACMKAAEARYGVDALSVDHLDGVSIAFEDWRFNLRNSNTEPLVRLNVETRGDTELLAAKTAELQRLIEKTAQ